MEIRDVLISESVRANRRWSQGSKRRIFELSTLGSSTLLYGLLKDDRKENIKSLKIIAPTRATLPENANPCVPFSEPDALPSENQKGTTLIGPKLFARYLRICPHVPTPHILTGSEGAVWSVVRDGVRVPDVVTKMWSYNYHPPSYVANCWGWVGWDSEANVCELDNGQMKQVVAIEWGRPLRQNFEGEPGGSRRGRKKKI
ncbi:hypothetical protein BDQ17DRAFT_1337827 [Cyathus striatus]|nr:hypothetical protein BDQ17DRAFT_1337827 [Cyathus striatus]